MTMSSTKIFGDFMEAARRQAEWRKQFLIDQEARDKAAHERVMQHVAEMIASGRAREITISDVAKITDTERYLNEMGSDMDEAHRKHWNI